MDASRLLSLVDDACRKAGARWVVIGGIAMNAYGHARATLDFDVAAEERFRDGLVEALGREGFQVVLDVEGFTNLLHPDTALGRVDLMWLERVTAEKVFERSRRLPGPGALEVPVPAPEHLVAMKVRSLSSRPNRVFRDGADLQHLLAVPGLDHNEARGYFDQAGLAKLYDRLRAPG